MLLREICVRVIIDRIIFFFGASGQTPVHTISEREMCAGSDMPAAWYRGIIYKLTEQLREGLQ